MNPVAYPREAQSAVDVLYHGTMIEFLPEIARRGLEPKAARPTMEPGSVYVWASRSFDGAAQWANNRSAFWTDSSHVVHRPYTVLRLRGRFHVQPDPNLPGDVDSVVLQDAVPPEAIEVLVGYERGAETVWVKQHRWQPIKWVLWIGAREGERPERTPETPEQLAQLSDRQLEDLPIEVLDRAAFGFVDGDVIEVPVDEIYVWLPGDLERAECDLGGDRRKANWYLDDQRHNPVHLVQRGGRLALDDGHHRYVSARLLGRPTLWATVHISDNPIVALRKRYGQPPAPPEDPRWAVVQRKRNRKKAREARESGSDQVHITIDRDATNRARGDIESSGPSDIVGTFDDALPLYRILDGQELRRIVQTGQITGGMFATPEEREYGASWASDVDALVPWGLGWQRNKRLGPDLFVAEIDAQGHRFYHMGPDDVPFEPQGAPEQRAEMSTAECNTGLGCSVVNVSYAQARFYHVDKGKTLSPMSHAEVEAYVATLPRKAVELLPVTPDLYYTGAIHGVDVIVVRNQESVPAPEGSYNKALWGEKHVEGPHFGTWQVERRDGTPIVMGARSMKIAVKRATEIIQSGGPPVDLLSKTRQREWDRARRARG